MGKLCVRDLILRCFEVLCCYEMLVLFIDVLRGCLGCLNFGLVVFSIFWYLV